MVITFLPMRMQIFVDTSGKGLLYPYIALDVTFTSLSHACACMWGDLGADT